MRYLLFVVGAAVLAYVIVMGLRAIAGPKTPVKRRINSKNQGEQG